MAPTAVKRTRVGGGVLCGCPAGAPQGGRGRPLGSGRQLPPQLTLTKFSFGHLWCSRSMDLRSCPPTPRAIGCPRQRPAHHLCTRYAH